MRESGHERKHEYRHVTLTRDWLCSGTSCLVAVTLLALVMKRETEPQQATSTAKRGLTKANVKRTRQSKLRETDALLIKLFT